MSKSEGYSRLVDAIATGAVAMIGAGSSRRVGYPLWSTLVAQLSDLASDANPAEASYLRSLNNSSLLLRASACEKSFGRQATRSYVAQSYSPKIPAFDSFHETVLRLPFRHYLTTNYDSVLEKGYADVFAQPAHSFDFNERTRLQALIDKSRTRDFPRTVVHVHGSVADPERIILTQDDYDARYQAENWATLALINIFTLYPCVFIGCGLADDDLGPLRFLTAVLGGGSETKHFAIMQQPRAEDEAALRLKLAKLYRIEPVFYPISDDHQAILPFMQQLLADVEERRQQITFDGNSAVEEVLTAANRILADAPEKLLELRNALPPVLQERLVPSSPAAEIASALAVAPAHTERTAIDDEIDAAFRFVKPGQPEIAIELLRQLLKRPRFRHSGNPRHCPID